MDHPPIPRQNSGSLDMGLVSSSKESKKTAASCLS